MQFSFDQFPVARYRFLILGKLLVEKEISKIRLILFFHRCVFHLDVIISWNFKKLRSYLWCSNRYLVLNGSNASRSKDSISDHRTWWPSTDFNNSSVEFYARLLEQPAKLRTIFEYIFFFFTRSFIYFLFFFGPLTLLGFYKKKKKRKKKTRICLVRPCCERKT